MKKFILFSIIFVLAILHVTAQNPISIESSETFLGAKAKGFMTIRYAAINPGDNNLRRPLIVVEGFDPGHLISPEYFTIHFKSL